mmetsp:Transcript_14085/g.49596  ORF Transcript_14085/g.49596 Transcript_14085/m.49596 type:complete len:191 (+) Transcript_14085:19-591(+)
MAQARTDGCSLAWSEQAEAVGAVVSNRSELAAMDSESQSVMSDMGDSCSETSVGTARASRGIRRHVSFGETSFIGTDLDTECEPMVMGQAAPSLTAIKKRRPCVFQPMDAHGDSSSSRSSGDDEVDGDEDAGISDVQRWSGAADQRRIARCVGASCRGTLNPELTLKTSDLWLKRRQGTTLKSGAVVALD